MRLPRAACGSCQKITVSNHGVERVNRIGRLAAAVQAEIQLLPLPVRRELCVHLSDQLDALGQMGLGETRFVKDRPGKNCGGHCNIIYCEGCGCLLGGVNGRRKVRIKK